VAANALHAVEAGALARFFGAVICFEELELLPQRHFVEKQYAGGVFLGGKAILSRFAGDFGKVHAWMWIYRDTNQMATKMTFIEHVSGAWALRGRDSQPLRQDAHELHFSMRFASRHMGHETKRDLENKDVVVGGCIRWRCGCRAWQGQAIRLDVIKNETVLKRKWRGGRTIANGGCCRACRAQSALHPLIC
jgi:hypothetical protein